MSLFTLKSRTEVAALARTSPTHHVIHRFRKWEADIYIPESVQQQLVSRDLNTRTNARSYVAIRFRKVSRKQSGNKSFGENEFIEWNELDVKELTAPPVLAQQDITEDGRDCDDCPECDKNNHERCRLRDGCPQAYSASRR